MKKSVSFFSLNLIFWFLEKKIIALIFKSISFDCVYIFVLFVEIHPFCPYICNIPNGKKYTNINSILL